MDRETLEDTSDHFIKINSYEHKINKKKTLKKIYFNKTSIKIENKRQCKIFKRLNKGIHYHLEQSCWFEAKANKNPHRNYVRHVMNLNRKTSKITTYKSPTLNK